MILHCEICEEPFVITSNLQHARKHCANCQRIIDGNTGGKCHYRLVHCAAKYDPTTGIDNTADEFLLGCCNTLTEWRQLKIDGAIVERGGLFFALDGGEWVKVKDPRSRPAPRTATIITRATAWHDRIANTHGITATC